MAPRGRQRHGGPPAAPTVVSGVLGDPGDDDRIEVTFRIEGDRVRLSAGDHELGSWPLEDVSMTGAGTSLWYFEAEGDRLAFVPSRPAALEASALVTTSARSTRRRGRTRDEPRTPGTDQTEAAGSTDHRGEASTATPAPPVSRGEDRVRRRLPRPRLPKLTIRRTAERTSTDRTSRAIPAGEPVDRRRRRYWLGAIDFARRRGMFGLDRLPVDEANRDGDHQHTWEHPAAATSGPAQWICTICGGIRR